MKLHSIRGHRRRRHMRLLRRIQRERCIWTRNFHEWRMIERLHCAGLVTACISKWNLFGSFNGRPFKELAVFATESEALLKYHRVLPRVG